MKNSNELCHPLSLPFACDEIDSGSAQHPEEPLSCYFTEILLVREGCVRAVLNGEERKLLPGETAIFCPGVPHRAVPEEGTRFDLLRMDPDRLPEQPTYAPSLKAVFEAACRAGMPMFLTAEESRELELPELSGRCVLESRERAFGYDVSVLSRLSLICVALVRFWLSRGLDLFGREVQIDPIYSLSGYIQDHLNENIRVEELAAHCGLSYPWNAKKFREIYGVSCKDYIEQIRVARVEQLLLFTDYDLSRISEMTGYADCSHMIKNFKRIMEITPGQYRLKKKPE